MESHKGHIQCYIWASLLVFSNTTKKELKDLQEGVKEQVNTGLQIN